MLGHLEVKLPGLLRAVSIAAEQNGGPAPTGADQAEDQAGAAADQQELIRSQVAEQVEADLTALRMAKTALEKAADKCRLAREKIIEQAEGQLLDLSIDIARKVLMQEIQAKRYQIEPIVREALSRIPQRTDVVVHLHPDDLARCELAKQDGLDSAQATVRFTADPGVDRGECLLRTSEGTVKSTVEEHLAEITETLGSPE